MTKWLCCMSSCESDFVFWFKSNVCFIWTCTFCSELHANLEWIANQWNSCLGLPMTNFILYMCMVRVGWSGRLDPRNNMRFKSSGHHCKYPLCSPTSPFLYIPNTPYWIGYHDEHCSWECVHPHLLSAVLYWVSHLNVVWHKSIMRYSMYSLYVHVAD